MTKDMIDHVDFLDIKREYQLIKADILNAFETVLEDTQFVQGKTIEHFEQSIAEYCGTKGAVAVSSGTDALIVSLMALGIGYGDEVITTPFTFIATAEAISRVGARPVFVDIDPNTYNLDPSLIEAAITEKTKAIIPVHMYGHMADMSTIMTIAKRVGLFVIEDAAQAIGAKAPYKGRPCCAGSIGSVGCFSFYPTKNLGGCGDGGMLVSNNLEILQKARLLRDHGSNQRYYHKIIGGNFRLDTLQAAALNIKLTYLEQRNSRRRQIAQYYRDNIRGVILPLEIEGYEDVYHQFTVQSQTRGTYLQLLKAQKIGVGIYYPYPLHLQDCFKDLRYSKGDLPESEKASQTVFSLPIFPELIDVELNYIVDVLNSV